MNIAEKIKEVFKPFVKMAKDLNDNLVPKYDYFGANNFIVFVADDQLKIKSNIIFNKKIEEKEEESE